MAVDSVGDLHQEFNPMIEPHRQSPELFYSWARREEPVVFSQPLQAWLVTRYDDLMAVVSDPHTYSSAPALPSVWDNPPEVLAALHGCIPEASMMINADEPVHLGMRRVFNLAFTGRRVHELKPAMVLKANELVAGFTTNGRADLVAEYAAPFVRHVLSLAVGIPNEDIGQVHQWNEEFMKVFNPLLPVQAKLEAAQHYKPYEEYLTALLRSRAAQPQDDLASCLIVGNQELPPLGFNDALYLLRGTLSAGYDTTRDTIASALLVLMVKRELWDACKDDRTIRRVIEETLRLEAPHRGLMRVTTRAVILGGKQLPKGARLLLLFGSGNRDEQHFRDPELFDIDRRNVREHMAFGKGIHHCPGAPMARQEVLVALEVLRNRLPHLRLAPGFQPTYAASYFFRSPERVLAVW
jgi:cytochrome P450